MAETYQELTKFNKMKLEKSDRIISNADYEKLVGQYELWEEKLNKRNQELEKYFETHKDKMKVK